MRRTACACTVARHHIDEAYEAPLSPGCRAAGAVRHVCVATQYQIGIHATPHATMFIQSLIEKSRDAKLEHVLVDYDVPLKKKPFRKY